MIDAPVIRERTAVSKQALGGREMGLQLKGFDPKVQLFMGLMGALVLLPKPTNAQTVGASGYRNSEISSTDASAADTGYSVTETNAIRAADKGDLKSEGPVRMARFAYVTGKVTWRDGDTGNWSQATVNMPLHQGTEVFVQNGGRADLQFDDGSELRLGNGALVSLKTLFSDSKGEFTQIDMKQGLATLHSRHQDSVYQVDTPTVSVKFAGLTQVRFGVDGGSEIAVQTGSAKIEGAQGKLDVPEGRYLYLASSESVYMMRPTPSPDPWDRWNGERNEILSGGTNSKQHVPSNVGLVAGDLDAYGNWHQDPTNGWSWSPKNQPTGWRPYSDGRWVWDDAFGWTWVSNEPWGWAPYHYGTWFQSANGWNWCPGPYSQYWSPGVVSFADTGGEISWAPLNPCEVVYPAFCGLGLWGANWGLDFSIGWCGCYAPFGGGFCEGRRWDNGWCNGFRNPGGFGYRGGPGFEGRNGNHVGFGLAGNGGGGFNPRNAVNGTTVVSHDGFGGNGAYKAAHNGSTLFGSGRTLGVNSNGMMTSGPANITPTAASRTATRSFASSQPLSSALGRGTYQGALPSDVLHSLSVQRSLTSLRGGFQNGAGMGASEAASRARSSLNYSGLGGSGYRSLNFNSGTTRGFDGFGGRSAGSSGYSSGRTYSGGGRGYGGGGYSGSGHSSGGGYSGSGHSSGGGYSGGGHSSGGGHGSGGGGGGHR